MRVGRIIPGVESGRVLGVRVDCLGISEAVARIEALFATPGPPAAQVATVNPEFVMAARRDHAFASVLEAADLCLADGWGVEWALRRQGCAIPGRVPGVDLVMELASFCARNGKSLYLLGAREGVAAAAGRRLAEVHPGLRVAGSHAGSPNPSDDAEALRLIEAAHPDLLLVAYGHPHQDLWISRHRARLPVSVAIGVGGAFDYISGRIKRAPEWMRKAGLEWLYRLVRQPWRARRMAVLPLFALDVLFART